MARIRTIKPQFFQSEQIVEVPPYARLLFIGLWGLADREGRLLDRPRRIQAEIFPYEPLDVDEMLEMLEVAKLIQRYQANGEAYIQILTFTKHQQPHIKEAPSTIPAPFEHSAGPVLPPDLHPTSTPGREGNGIQEGKGAAARARAREGNNNTTLTHSSEINSEILDELQRAPAYALVDVRHVYEKMLVFCRHKGQSVDCERLIHWLNREHPTPASSRRHLRSVPRREAGEAAVVDSPTSREGLEALIALAARVGDERAETEAREALLKLDDRKGAA